MIKTFTVTDILFNKISRKKGTIEYHLLDEQGNERTVTAMALLGFGKKIKTARALYQREIPLVEVLANTDVDQTFTIDFTKFNKKLRIHKKLSIHNHSGAAAYSQSFSNVIPDASRFPLLVMLVVLGTLVVFMFGVFSN